MKHVYSLTFFCLLSLFSVAQQDTNTNYSLSTTKANIHIDKQKIQYTATTGYFQLENKTGKHIADVFHVSYIKNNVSDNKDRPVTFVFNGGPGSSSVWLHMGALGPKRIRMNTNGNAEPAPYTLIDNSYSWLDVTDLVFIDPVGSGFSKAKEGEDSKSFFGYKNDIESVGDFIRLWLVKNKRWGSPKYLAGESYGTTRACGVSDYIMSTYGIHLNGISLISPALNFQTLREYSDNDFPYIFNLPVYTRTAQYHNKFSDAKNSDTSLVSQAEKFALETYSVALLKGDLLSTQEKYAIAEKLAYFTSIPTDIFIQNNLRIPSWKFRKLLLASEHSLIGRFDTRLTMPAPLKNRDYASEDPSFTEINGAFTTGFNEYVQKELDYTNTLPFYSIGNVHPWKYGDGKYLNVTDELRTTMFTNPHMKVWVANGLYDLATSYFGAEYAIQHMNLPHELSENITCTYYNAGHMMYLVEQELQQLKNDAREFYK
ncbi:MAG: hypothetical protein R6U95_08275 [Bacteroidales bacterium]